MKWVRTIIGNRIVHILVFNDTGDPTFDEEIASVVIREKTVISVCEEMSINLVEELVSEKAALKHAKEVKKYIGSELIKREEY